MNAMYILCRIGEFSSVPRTRIQTIELNNEARVYSALDSAWIKDIHFKDRCKADPLNSSDKCEQRDLFRIARRRSFPSSISHLLFIYSSAHSWALSPQHLWATLAHHPQSLPRPGFQSWADRHQGNISRAPDQRVEISALSSTTWSNSQPVIRARS